MTPERRQAIEIMSECGMSPHEIVASCGSEGFYVDVVEVESIIGKPEPVTLTRMQEKILQRMHKECFYFPDEFDFCHRTTAREAMQKMEKHGILISNHVYDPKTKRSLVGYKLKEAA